MINELKKKLNQYGFSEIGTEQYSLLEDNVRKSINIFSEFVEMLLNDENVIEKTHDHDDQGFQFIICSK